MRGITIVLSLALVLAAFAGAARAEDVEVISPRADEVTLTIYRDLFAQVTEVRTVDLPAGPVTLTFAGVADTLMPRSAVVQQLDRDFVERNYDYDPLAPATLLRKSIGKSVTLTRTLPGSGKVIQVRAEILAANENGVTFRTEQGHEALRCSGIPEHLTFDELPGDLHPEPKLSLKLAAGKPGKRTIRLSYLAQGFAWSSDYVARLEPAGAHMDLTGWVTLKNFTNTRFRDAHVQVVAGRLNLLYEEAGGSSTIGATEEYADEASLQQAREARLEELDEEREAAESELTLLSGCYPFGAPNMPTERTVFQRSRIDFRSYAYGGDNSLEEVVVTGMRRTAAVRETLGDYQLYRLPWTTDLNARQTKQAVFLQKDAVRIERFYSFRLDPDEDDIEDGSFVRPSLVVSFKNAKASGLGEPLPAGMVRFFDGAPGGDIFAGEASLADKPVGLPVELRYAKAVDLTLQIGIDDDPDDASTESADVIDATFLASNAKEWPVSIEIRQAIGEDTANGKIVKSNYRTSKKFGDYAWRFTVPANSARSLTYRLLVPEEDAR